jgi:hypothetical protein
MSATNGSTEDVDESKYHTLHNKDAMITAEVRPLYGTADGKVCVIASQGVLPVKSRAAGGEAKLTKSRLCYRQPQIAKQTTRDNDRVRGISQAASESLAYSKEFTVSECDAVILWFRLELSLIHGHSQVAAAAPDERFLPVLSSATPRRPCRLAPAAFQPLAHSRQHHHHQHPQPSDPTY